MPIIPDYDQYVGTPRPTDLLIMYDMTGKETVCVSIQQIKDAILGVGINVGGVNPGDVLTNNGAQEISNKTLTESTIGTAVEVQVKDTPVDVSTKLGSIDDNVDTKEDKIGTSDKAYSFPYPFTGKATATIISDTDILDALGIDDALFAIASDSIVLQLRELDGGKYAVIPIDNSTITAVITPDEKEQLDQIEIDGLTEGTEYSLSLTLKVVERS